ncbi:(deoxy)nucleoside triphosphate pyrophosphohydrolase [Mycolicibacter minnesotensis]
MPTQVVVAGAIIAASAAGPVVLIAQRRRPPELAGRWELPGGKVMPGESEPAALARELGEELGLDAAAVTVGERLGADVLLTPTMTLRAYRVALAHGEPHPHDHQALRWVTAAQLADVDWVPADRAWLDALADALADTR